ncbi:MAG: hypothetical protein ABSH25_06605 [Syntrophorhabdales bacterium]|jgi:hypothetical protein
MGLTAGDLRIAPGSALLQGLDAAGRIFEKQVEYAGNASSSPMSRSSRTALSKIGASPGA